jgi:CubicO group peptidase (beta-lactamase class C family)
MKLARILPALALLAPAAVFGAQTPLQRFEAQAEAFREQLRIPGMSIAIVKDRKVLWAKGFGLADRENRVPATPETVYPIASLTKTFAATLVWQLVEQGKLDLEEPASHYSADFKDDSVRIKHLLSHTSNGTPGEKYQYDGNRFDYLTAVIEKTTGKSFREVMVRTFLDPLAMKSSVPGEDVLDEPGKWAPVLGKENLDRYRKIVATRQAQPYTLYGDQIVHSSYPAKFFGAAAGMLSTVLDMARFDAAIDRHAFLRRETQEKAWTPFISNSGQRLPHGLGWFVEDYHGARLIWHYGHWGTGFSATYLKVPEKNLTLVILANSEALSDHQFQVEGDRIASNVFACSFLSVFVAADDCRDARTALTKWLADRRAKARVAVQWEADALEPYVGQYRFEALDRTLTVWREGARLYADIPKGSKAELYVDAESKFFFKIRPWVITFAKDATRVTGMDVLIDRGETLHAPKVR